MDIPLRVEVRCGDIVCGQSVAIVLNPITEKVTHIVVQEKRFPQTERLVPLEQVAETAPQRIELRCALEEFEKMESFVETRFVRAEPPYALVPGPAYSWPFVLQADDRACMAVERERIPAGEESLRRGAVVHATDGTAGTVDELLVDPTSSHITHLVLREGHLWGQRDVVIPVAEIERIEENAIYLKLDRGGVEKLPVIPIRRKSTVPGDSM